jgi:hypothetical protein
VNRRNFIFGAAILPLAFKLQPMPTAPTDEYTLFLERVRSRVIEVVRREQRGLHRLEIDPPRANGGLYVRRVKLTLAAGPSLLDSTFFQWDEVSGSRWSGD